MLCRFKPKTRVYLLLFAVWSISILVGWALAGLNGLAVAAVAASIGLCVIRISADKMVLRILRAQPVGPCEHRNLFGRVQVLANRMGMAFPEVYYIPVEVPNILSVSRAPGQGAIIVTDGLVEKLTDDELNATIAHELASIRQGEVMVGVVAGLLAYMVLACIPRSGKQHGGSGVQLFFFFLFAPLAAVVIRLAIAPDREYNADAEGANVLGSSKGLNSALGKLEAESEKRDLPVSEAFGHLFLIPQVYRARSILRLFDTHPTTESRIEHLSQIQIALALDS